jgi:hypothetical protein
MWITFSFYYYYLLFIFLIGNRTDLLKQMTKYA